MAVICIKNICVCVCVCARARATRGPRNCVGGDRGGAGSSSASRTSARRPGLASLVLRSLRAGPAPVHVVDRSRRPGPFCDVLSGSDGLPDSVAGQPAPARGLYCALEARVHDRNCAASGPLLRRTVSTLGWGILMKWPGWLGFGISGSLAT